MQYIAWFGTYGNPSRQRFRCTSADGTTHRFAGVLPRLRVEDEVCQHCDNEVYRHQGPLLTSNYDFHLRLAAKRYRRRHRADPVLASQARGLENVL